MSAENRFKSLMLELGTRRNNEHIGSGLGGDPEIFLSLLALNVQYLSDKDAPLFTISDDILNINSDKFISSSLKEIRKELSEVITSDIKGQYAPRELVDLLEFKNKDLNFSNLNLSPRQEQLLEGFILAQRLRTLVEAELVQPKTFNQLSPQLQLTYSQMNQLPDWVILVSMRTQIGIEFLVQYNLDELFGDLLNRINNGVEVPTT